MPAWLPPRLPGPSVQPLIACHVGACLLAAVSPRRPCAEAMGRDPSCCFLGVLTLEAERRRGSLVDLVLGGSEQSQFLGTRPLFPVWSLDEPGLTYQTQADCAEVLVSCPRHQSDPGLLLCEDRVLIGSHIYCMAVCRGRRLGSPRPGRTAAVDPFLL